MNRKAKIGKKALHFKKTQKRRRFFDDVDLLNSPFHEIVKTGSYINKKGVQKGFAIFKERDFFKEKNDRDAEKQISPIPVEKNKLQRKLVLYLNQNGDLYRKPKDKYCYPMSEKGNRHRIIRFLATNKGYQLTEFISTELGIESEKSIRTEIGKIKNNIEKYLKINGKDFLQGKKESGYRINPKYKIIPKTNKI